uniref:Uncharacterized protein n=1 Tax=Brassica oleracea TaxID=3712 RepID=A0A3P6FN92_BRAOL|nr:unnamed protein product [Brassica oleracea]
MMNSRIFITIVLSLYYRFDSCIRSRCSSRSLRC